MYIGKAGGLHVQDTSENLVDPASKKPAKPMLAICRYRRSRLCGKSDIAHDGTDIAHDGNVSMRHCPRRQYVKAAHVGYMSVQLKAVDITLR